MNVNLFFRNIQRMLWVKARNILGLDSQYRVIGRVSFLSETYKEKTHLWSSSESYLIFSGAQALCLVQKQSAAHISTGALSGLSKGVIQ